MRATRLKQLFWLVMAGGVFMILFHRITPAGGQRVAEAVTAAAGSSGTGLFAPVAPANPYEPVVSQDGRTMTWQGKKYVKIEDHWFEERADHTYKVNGITTYFVDKSKAGSTPPPGDGQGAELPAGRAMDENRQSLLKNSKDLLKRAVNGNPLSAYSPEQVARMMETIRKTQDQVKERDKVLRDLSSADR